MQNPEQPFDSSLRPCICCGERCELPADIDANVCANCGLRVVDETAKLRFDASFYGSAGIHMQD